MAATVFYGAGLGHCLHVGDDTYEVLRAFCQGEKRAAIVQRYPMRKWEPRVVVETAGGWQFADCPKIDAAQWMKET